MATEETIGARFTLHGVRQVQSGVRSISNSFRDMRNTVRSLVFGLTAFTAAALGISKMAIETGGKVVQMENSFRGLASSAGESADVMLNKVNAALDGTVSRFETMRLVNQAVLLGLPATADEMAHLADLAQRLGRAVGRTATEAFGDLVTGIGRQSRLILDNLGIVVKAQFAYDAFAKSVGKNVDALTDLEKKQAFYNEALRAAELAIGRIGDEQLEASDKVQKFIATITDIRDELLKLVAKSPTVNKFLDDINEKAEEWFDLIQNNQGLIEDFIRSAVSSLQSFANAFIAFGADLFALVKFLVDNAQTLIELFLAMKALSFLASLASLFGGVVRAGVGIANLFNGGGIGAAARGLFGLPVNGPLVPGAGGAAVGAAGAASQAAQQNFVINVVNPAGGFIEGNQIGRGVVNVLAQARLNDNNGRVFGGNAPLLGPNGTGVLV
jgi:hypothetical protein